MAPIFNLSRHRLPPDEISVLSRTLSFVPTARTNLFEVKLEIQRFLRKIRLNHFFGCDTLQPQIDVTGFRPLSTFTPPSHTMPSEILAFEKMVMKDIDTLSKEKKYIKYNLTCNGSMAIKDLRNNTEVVIKSAHKCSRIVIQVVSDYRQELLQQLSDTMCYKKIKGDPTEGHKIWIAKITKKGLEWEFISKKEHLFLNKEHPRLPVLYTLPKHSASASRAGAEQQAEREAVCSTQHPSRSSPPGRGSSLKAERSNPRPNPRRGAVESLQQ
ncbi:hypothetical protein NDU88_002417 [Pleurodeles waltl]|uniref:Uncharacterized protein n=1 Tax=Pleurodeles waltl TaxID=8319 RepID=A0AAV7T1Z7_PLEWA|nr:hypothetical protein NDU88_002417 [Pleurodeles waltl]